MDERLGLEEVLQVEVDGKIYEIRKRDIGAGGHSDAPVERMKRLAEDAVREWQLVRLGQYLTEPATKRSTSVQELVAHLG